MAKVYIRTDARGCLVGIDSDVFLEAERIEAEGWVFLDEGEGDRYALAQGNYLPLPLVVVDEDGAVYRYRYDAAEQAILERAEAELEADRAALPEPEPSHADRLVRMLAVNELLTDTQMEDIAEAFRPWKAGTLAQPQAYAAQEVVQLDGRLYRCAQAHVHHGEPGWSPADQNALWVALGLAVEDPDEIPQWVQPGGAHDAYALGDRVRYEGKVWESEFDGPNTWAPGTYGWVEVVET